jgi:hypothetical protein
MIMADCVSDQHHFVCIKRSGGYLKGRSRATFKPAPIVTRGRSFSAPGSFSICFKSGTGLSEFCLNGESMLDFFEVGKAYTFNIQEAEQ